MPLWHGSLGCNTCDPSGNLTFQCNTLRAKTKNQVSRQQGKAKTTNKHFEPQKITAKPFWKQKRSISVHFGVLRSLNRCVQPLRGFSWSAGTLQGWLNWIWKHSWSISGIVSLGMYCADEAFERLQHLGQAGMCCAPPAIRHLKGFGQPRHSGTGRSWGRLRVL